MTEIGSEFLLNIPTRIETEKKIKTTKLASALPKKPGAPKEIVKKTIAITVATSDALKAPRHICLLDDAISIYALTFFSRLVVITALSSSSAPTKSAAHNGINAESIAGRASMAVTK